MRARQHQPRRRAAALISMIVILVVVAAFAAVFLSVHTAQLATEEHAIHRLRAQAATLAATHLTLWQLRNDPDLQNSLARVVYEGDTSFAADALFEVNGDLAGATFRVDVWPGADTVRLKSTGISGGVYYERWAQLAIEPAAAGLAVSDKIELRDDAFIDSFDSRLGPYGGANVSSRASVSTNSTGKDKIHLKDRTVLYGNARVGPGGDPANVIRVDAGATLTGNTGVLGVATEIPSLSEPSNVGDSLGDLKVSSGTTTWASNKHYHKVEFKSSAVLEISGDVVVLADHDFKFRGDAQLRILPGSSLTLYGNKKVKFEKNSRGNVNTADPSKFKIFMLGGPGDHLETKHTAQLYAVAVHPQGGLKVNDTSHFCGVFAGKNIKLAESGAVHQDRALGGPGGKWP